MGRNCFVLFLIAFCFLFGLIRGSPGDADPIYQGCVEQCETTGCVGDKRFRNCNFSNPNDRLRYRQEPNYVEWKKWVCQSDCRYHCIIAREDERQTLGHKPLKYHHKWPSEHVHGIQEPAAVLLSGLTLAMHFHGWISFLIQVNYKLPFRPNNKSYYEYTGLWHVYALLAMNAWLWSGAFHSQDVELTEKLDCSSAVAFAGYSLFLAIIRVFNVRVEATRVMVAAPIFAFAITHILMEHVDVRVDGGDARDVVVHVGGGFLTTGPLDVVGGDTRGDLRDDLDDVRFPAVLGICRCSRHLARDDAPSNLLMVEFRPGRQQV